MVAGLQSSLLRQVFADVAKRYLHEVAAVRQQGSASTSGSLSNRVNQVQRRSQSFFREEVPQDSAGQANYLRQLNQKGDPEAVIRQFEAGRINSTEATLGEYVKALVKVDRLDSTALAQTLQRGARAQQAGASTSYASPNAFGSFASQAGQDASASQGSGLYRMFGGAAGANSGVATELGSSKNPIYMMQAEPTFKAQLWRTVRTLTVAFLIISGIGALFDERGLGKGILHNPDMKPQLDCKTKFEDVKGVDEAKSELEEVVAYLRDPHKFTTLGGKLPKGVLLVGPPGTGKTMLARAIAGEAGVPFFYCSASEFEEMFVGVGARRVRDLFAAAKKASPCIVFIDEVDAIGGKRNSKDQQYMRMTLNQLLVELDGFKPSDGVICIAATNFPQSLDKALIRPGRFDRHVTVPNPDVKGRKEILEVHFKNVPAAKDVDLKVIARGTPGFSGADLANLVNVAALKAAREGQLAVSMAALEFAKDRIMMGAERKSAVISENNRKLTAYHEGGHALVALLTDGALPVHKATIVPRGMALGMVMQLPDQDDETSVSRRQLLAKLDVCMGGRVAEELIFGESNITTGASSDLEQATKLARNMVTKYGMSEKVGNISIDYEDDGRSLSSETRSAVEEEVKRLVQTAYQRAKTVLQQHDKDLHTLATALLERETMSGQQIKELLGIKSQTKVAITGTEVVAAPASRSIHES
ncbi:ATP-dependent zinc metalloprotease FTSH 4, mitochondrial [Trebouxia sp. C0009 RCD-2024]